jgi:hypothetical protein
MRLEVVDIAAIKIRSRKYLTTSTEVDYTLTWDALSDIRRHLYAVHTHCLYQSLQKEKIQQDLAESARRSCNIISSPELVIHKRTNLLKLGIEMLHPIVWKEIHRFVHHLVRG